MAKKKEFHFTFKVFLRLLIFFLILYFSITYFQQQKSSVLGTVDITLSLDEEKQNNFLSGLYQKLPESSRYQIEHFNENPTVIYIQDQLDGFPSKQIKELKKSIVKNVSDSIIENIENN